MAFLLFNGHYMHFVFLLTDSGLPPAKEMIYYQPVALGFIILSLQWFVYMIEPLCPCFEVNVSECNKSIRRLAESS